MNAHELTLPCQEFLLISLDGHIVISLFMGALLYNSKISFADDNVVIKLLVYRENWVFA